MTVTQTEKPVAEKPVAAAKAKTPAAPAAPTVTGSALATMFEKAMKSKTPKLSTVKKQNYFRLMLGKSAICYVNASKKHARITISVPVSDAADVAEVVTFIQRSIALQSKADSAS